MWNCLEAAGALSELEFPEACAIRIKCTGPSSQFIGTAGNGLAHQWRSHQKVLWPLLFLHLSAATEESQESPVPHTQLHVHTQRPAVNASWNQPGVWDQYLAWRTLERLQSHSEVSPSWSHPGRWISCLGCGTNYHKRSRIRQHPRAALQVWSSEARPW